MLCWSKTRSAPSPERARAWRVRPIRYACSRRKSTRSSKSTCMRPGAWMGRSQRWCGSSASGVAAFTSRAGGFLAMSPPGMRGSEYREGICRGARAADDVERSEHQHEVIALLLDTGLGQRLQEGIVQQGRAVGKEAGVHRPRDVVADGLMVEHVPDQHAHVVVPQEGQARDVEPGPGEGRAEGPAIGRLGIGALPRLA